MEVVPSEAGGDKRSHGKTVGCLAAVLLVVGIAQPAYAYEEQVILPPNSAWASQTYSGLSPDGAFDNNTATIWSSGAFAPQWIAATTGFRLISHIELVVSMYPNGYASHDVYVHDGNQWSYVTTVKGVMQEGQVFTVPINTTASPFRAPNPDRFRSFVKCFR